MAMISFVFCLWIIWVFEVIIKASLQILQNIEHTYAKFMLPSILLFNLIFVYLFRRKIDICSLEK